MQQISLYHLHAKNARGHFRILGFKVASAGAASMSDRTPKSYDQKCYELAEYFLAGHGRPESWAKELAQTIQDAVENWFREETNP